MSTVETQAAVKASPVEGKGTFTWTLKLYERQGTCHLQWHADAPFRAQQGRVCLYKDRFPQKPTDDVVAWTWDDTPDNPFDTGKPWGAGWCAAYIAELNGTVVYVCKTPVTSNQGS